MVTRGSHSYYDLFVDYLDIRKHFIQNEVLNWELGMHIYGFILRNEYAARIHDCRTVRPPNGHIVFTSILTYFVL